MSSQVKARMETTGLLADKLRTQRKSLPEALQLLHRRTLLNLGQSGKPPTRDQLETWATELHIDLDASLRHLAEAELVFLDPAGREITGGVPFAPGPTAHQVRIVGGPSVYANCAIDALGIGAMLGRDVDVQSLDPFTGQEVTASSRAGHRTWQPVGSRVRRLLGPRTPHRNLLSGDQLLHHHRPCPQLPAHARPGRCCPRLLGRGGSRNVGLRRAPQRTEKSLMTQPSPTDQQHSTPYPLDDTGTPQDRGARRGPSGWWIGLLALLPIACCGLPLLLAAGVTVGSGAVLGGVAGAVLMLLGATVLGVWGMRRRAHSTRPADTSPAATPDCDRCW